jgi:hypothetical protein
MQPKNKKEETTMTIETPIKAELHHFTGSETWHRHALVRDVLFTDGAKHVADTGSSWNLPERAR